MKSFLQTTEWLKFQESIGHKTWSFDNGPIKANIIEHKIPFGKNYLYIPHGPEIFFDNIQGGLKNEVDNFLKYLKDLAKENKSIFIKMEPLSDIVVETIFRKGIRRSNKQIQPYKTVIINLNLSEEELLLKMHHKARYNIKVADRHGVRVELSEDVDAFWELLEKTSKKDRFYSHTKDYYKKLLKAFGGGEELKTELFLAYYEDLPAGRTPPEAMADGVRAGKPVAGAIVMLYKDTAYYLHGASDYEARSLMAPYALHWSMITSLKEKGLRFYDLWGIDSARWPGVTRFKLGWLGSLNPPTGGKGAGWLKEYPGSFDIVISKFWYLAYNFARKIF